MAVVDAYASFDVQAVGQRALQVDVAGKITHVVDMPVGRMHVDIESCTVGAMQHDLGLCACRTETPSDCRSVDRLDHDAQVAIVVRRQEIETDKEGNITG